MSKALSIISTLTTVLLPGFARAQYEVDTIETLSPEEAAAAVGVVGSFLGLSALMIGLLALLGLVSLILWIWAIVDCARRQFTNPSDKNLWLILVIVLGLFGFSLIISIIYLAVGRKKGTLPGAKPAA